MLEVYLQHPNVLSLSSDYIIVYFCTYLSGFSLEAPRKYVHPGLVLGLD
jgi:hypothetical protein